ncbi:MAG: DHA2 family efflux MFS transporter permease subunit [Rickettsiales bacterium]|nr:MAG: DHA2 family efflux MFS transporter permease subunit [Rickettsiales bacterium]
MDQEQINQKIPPKTILAFFAMVVGMFMAILDIQIVASSLSVIAAGLSASGDELSWIQTSYLIAEVIIIPITGFAARLLSIRIAYFIAALGFTIMSIFCSLAVNIEAMIICRALQGFFGGAMIPTTFSTIFIIFPKHMRTKVNMIVGLVVTVAPTIGPTLGGYITETISWHFMFLLNVIPGIFVCVVVFLYVDFDKPNYKLLNNFDLKGMLLMAFCLGSFQYVLEEGNNKGWLDDSHILFLSILIGISFVCLMFRELTFENPIIDLSAYKNKNFSLGCIYAFILGVGLFGSVYLLPLFLFSVSGFNTLQIGVTMIVTGAFQFVSAPLTAKMIERGVDKRIILAIGFSLFSWGCYLNSSLTADSGYWDMFYPQMVRGLSLMFCFMPINDLALGTMSKDQVQNASGLYNLTRNLGGAIGLAMINNIIINKSSAFVQTMKDNMPLTSPQVQETISALTQGLSGKVNDPQAAAYMMLNGIIQKEALVMAINNVFMIIAGLFCFGIMLIPFLTPPQAGVSVNAH